MGVFEKDLVVDPGYYRIGAEADEDPYDLLNPVVALLVVLGAVDKENADNRQRDYTQG